MTELPIPPQVFWGLTALLAFGFLCWAIVAIQPKAEAQDEAPLARMKQSLGLQSLPDGVFVLLFGLWGALFGVLTIGLFALIWDVLWHDVPVRDDTRAVWDFRFRLVQITALTTVLGAVVALPVTLQKLRHSQAQAETAKAAEHTAKAALFNDKITEAAAGLHTQRQVSVEVDGKWETRWEDDVVRRNAAIDRLEGLVRDEQPREAGRVARLLSVYVRELSKVTSAENPPDTDDVVSLKEWAGNLNIPRSDMENAAQVLGRLTDLGGQVAPPLKIDLRNANLQAMDLSNLNLKGALLTGANLQGADLKFSELQDADFEGAHLQGTALVGSELQNADFSNASLLGTDLGATGLRGAYLIGAKMRGADLFGAEMEGVDLFAVELKGADLCEARLQGAKLDQVEFDEDTNLAEAFFAAASVRNVDFTNVPQILEHLDDLFGDETVKLPKGTTYPSHWYKDEETLGDYNTQWRAFAASKGVSIPD